MTGLVDAADGLSRACDAFDKHAGPALKRRAKIGEALEHVDRLGDILELPRLVATCVRAGHWAEALDLAQRADELELRARASDLTGSARLLRKVKDEIVREIVGLRARVLETLRERTLKLPAAMRSIAILRRLGDGKDNEPTLRLIFLAARADCLSGQLDQLQAGAHGDADEDRVRFVKRWIEIWRDVVGDTAAIYADVFGPSGAKAMVALHTFLQHALSRLLAMLQSHLPHITPVSSLSALLTQLSYCAAAFGRHGLDFRPTIASLITQRLSDVITAKWLAAHEALAAELSRAGSTLDDWLIAPDARAKLLTTDLPAAPALPSGLTAPPSLVDAAPIDFSSATPSQSLTLLPPIARLANAHATALNELRLLPAQSLYPTLRSAQTASLVKSGDALLTLVNAVAEDDVEVVRRAIGCFARALAPYFEHALRRGVYGKEEVEDESVAQLRIRCEEAMARLKERSKVVAEALAVQEADE